MYPKLNEPGKLKDKKVVFSIMLKSVLFLFWFLALVSIDKIYFFNHLILIAICTFLYIEGSDHHQLTSVNGKKGTNGEEYF